MNEGRLEFISIHKTCVKRPLSKRTKIGFQDQISLNAGQKYCRILLTFMKLPFVIKIFVLSIFSGRFTQVLLYTLGSGTAIVALYHVTTKAHVALKLPKSGCVALTYSDAL